MAPDKKITNVIVGTGNIYVAEFPTEPPEQSVPFGGDYPADWIYPGLTEEGVSQSFERDVSDHRVEEQSSVALQTVNTSTISYTLSLAEHTLENMLLSFGTGSIETVTGTPAGVTVRRLRFSDELNYFSLSFEGKAPDGAFYRYYIPRVSSTATSETSHRRSEAKKLLPVTLTAVCDMADIFVDEIKAAA
jgi:hypothetical protein